jgi:hypothetical protein
MMRDDVKDAAQFVAHALAAMAVVCLGLAGAVLLVVWTFYVAAHLWPPF